MTIYSKRIKKLFHNKTVRNGGLFAVFSFFNKGISFILLTILARYIAPAEYGELSLFNTLVLLFSYIVGLSTSGYVSVSFFKKEPAKFKQDFSAICVITVLTSIVLCCCLVAFSTPLSKLLKLSTSFLFLGFFISFANTFVNLNLDYFRVKEKLSLYGLLSCSFALLNFLLTLYLVIVKNLNWPGQVFSLLICNLIFSLIALIIFQKNKLLVLPKKWRIYKRIILWGLPIIPHLASGWIKQGLDRYIIADTHSLSEVGLFSFAMTLTSTIIMVGTAFNQTNSVNLYQTLSSNESFDQIVKTLRRKEKFLASLYLFLVISIMICGFVLIPILMPKYSSCVPYFLILSVYGFFQCIYLLYCNYLFYFDNTKQLMMITFGSSILHLILSLWLTRYSLFYTCFIYVFTIIIVVLLVFLQSRKLLKIRGYAQHKKFGIQ